MELFNKVVKIVPRQQDAYELKELEKARQRYLKSSHHQVDKKKLGRQFNQWPIVKNL